MKTLKENFAEQISNIVDSMARIYDERLSKEKIETATKINFLLKQAEKNRWSEDYISAIKDVKKILKITNSIYDLYV